MAIQRLKTSLRLKFYISKYGLKVTKTKRNKHNRCFCFIANKTIMLFGVDIGKIAEMGQLVNHKMQQQ